MDTRQRETEYNGLLVRFFREWFLLVLNVHKNVVFFSGFFFLQFAEQYSHQLNWILQLIKHTIIYSQQKQLLFYLNSYARHIWGEWFQNRDKRKTNILKKKKPKMFQINKLNSTNNNFMMDEAIAHWFYCIVRNFPLILADLSTDNAQKNKKLQNNSEKQNNCLRSACSKADFKSQMRPSKVKRKIKSLFSIVILLKRFRLTRIDTLHMHIVCISLCIKNWWHKNQYYKTLR